MRRVCSGGSVTARAIVAGSCLAALALVLAGCGTQVDSKPAGDGADRADQIVAVEQMLAAANDGEFAAWRSFYADDAVIPLPTTADISSEDYFEFEAALNTRTVPVVPCTLVGAAVSCSLRIENDLVAAAGVLVEVEELFFLDDGNRILTRQSKGVEEYRSFWEAYRDWLETAHPEVYGQVMEDGSRTRFLFTGEQAPLFMAHIEEFVADSGQYGD